MFYCTAPPNETFAALARALDDHAGRVGKGDLVLCHGDFKLDNIMFHPEKVQARRNRGGVVGG